MAYLGLPSCSKTLRNRPMKGTSTKEERVPLDIKKEKKIQGNTFTRNTSLNSFLFVLHLYNTQDSTCTYSDSLPENVVILIYKDESFQYNIHKNLHHHFYTFSPPPNSVWSFKHAFIFLIAADQISNSITTSGPYKIKRKA